MAKNKIFYCILSFTFLLTAGPVYAQSDTPDDFVTESVITAQNFPEITVNTGLTGKVSSSNKMCYRALDNYYETISLLTLTYPDLTKSYEIGTSWNGNPLTVIKISNDSIAGEKAKMFLMGGIHGNERAGAETAMRFAEYILSNYAINPKIKALVDNREIHILPVVNPDGYAIYKRKNDSPDTKCSISKRGTDLNRNNGYKWKDKKRSCYDNYPGSSADSEPETQAIQAYMNSIFTDQNGIEPGQRKGIFVSMHAWGGSVSYPLWYTKTAPPSASIMKSIAKEMASKNKYKVGQGSRLLYKTTGSFEDWAYHTYGIPSFTIEVGKNKLLFTKCKYFEPTVSKNMDALLVALRRADG